MNFFNIRDIINDFENRLALFFHVYKIVFEYKISLEIELIDKTHLLKLKQNLLFYFDII